MDTLSENARLSAIIYSVVKHLGVNMNLTLKDAASDQLPSRIQIGYNVIGDDAIVTVLVDDQIVEE